MYFLGYLKFQLFDIDLYHLQNSGKADSAQMGLAQLGGVFIVLTGGVIVACFAAVGEFLWENRQMTAKGVCINSCNFY